MSNIAIKQHDMTLFELQFPEFGLEQIEEAALYIKDHLGYVMIGDYTVNRNELRIFYNNEGDSEFEV